MMDSPATTSRSSLRPMHLHSTNLSPTQNLRYDAPAGLVVFLVALPLCLGVALASNAPLLSGLIAGVIGGVVIPLVSRSPLSVSGPAAGLAAIVATGVERLGGFDVICAATVIAGSLQLALGAMRAGVIVSFIPSSVVRGMLSAIGILLVLKQVPHAIGYDHEAFESDSFVVAGEGNTFSLIGSALRSLQWGAFTISAVALLILIAFDRIKMLKKLAFFPAALAVVLVGTAMNAAFGEFAPGFALEGGSLVRLPATSGPAALLDQLTLVDFRLFGRATTWTLGVTLAIVASLETLLSLDAIDKLDPFRRRSDPNRELLAQGLANVTSGVVGGLPITSVIVRSSAGVNAGGRTRATSFIHGVLLLVAVAFASVWLNHIPLAALATILVVTGFKLARPSVFRSMYRIGKRHFIPFVVTILAIVFTDLLRGIAIGIVVGLVFTIRESMKGVYELTETETGIFRLRFLKDVHFFHKAAVVDVLEGLAPNTLLIVDRGLADYLERDVIEAICEFRLAAQSRGVEIELEGIEPVTTMAAH